MIWCFSKVAILGGALCTLLVSAMNVRAQTSTPDPNRPTAVFDHQPFEYGVLVQSGVGVTENRGGFKFLWGGVLRRSGSSET